MGKSGLTVVRVEKNNTMLINKNTRINSVLCTLATVNLLLPLLYFITRWEGWQYDAVNVLNVNKLHALKRLILCYINFIPIKNFSKLNE